MQHLSSVCRNFLTLWLIKVKLCTAHNSLKCQKVRAERDAKVTMTFFVLRHSDICHTENIDKILDMHWRNCRLPSIFDILDLKVTDFSSANVCLHLVTVFLYSREFD